MNTAQHDRARRRESLTHAQELLDEAQDLQDEIRLKLHKIHELTGIKLSALEDLDDVGDVEGMVDDD